MFSRGLKQMEGWFQGKPQGNQKGTNPQGPPQQVVIIEGSMVSNQTSDEGSIWSLGNLFEGSVLTTPPPPSILGWLKEGSRLTSGAHIL